MWELLLTEAVKKFIQGEFSSQIELKIPLKLPTFSHASSNQSTFCPLHKATPLFFPCAFQTDMWKLPFLHFGKTRLGDYTRLSRFLQPVFESKVL